MNPCPQITAHGFPTDPLPWQEQGTALAPPGWGHHHQLGDVARFHPCVGEAAAICSRAKGKVLEMLVLQMFLGRYKFSFPFIYEFMKMYLKEMVGLFLTVYHYHFKIPFTFIFSFPLAFILVNSQRFFSSTTKNPIFSWRNLIPPPATIPFF